LTKYGIRVVRKIEDGPDVFFFDRHFIHEVTSPGCLKERGISVLYPERTLPLPITTHQL
jgi:3-isopropylmalate/(R)-2-methylmalate dehydratase large subunit